MSKTVAITDGGSQEDYHMVVEKLKKNRLVMQGRHVGKRDKTTGQGKEGIWK